MADKAYYRLGNTGPEVGFCITLYFLSEIKYKCIWITYGILWLCDHSEQADDFYYTFRFQDVIMMFFIAGFQYLSSALYIH